MPGRFGCRCSSDHNTSARCSKKKASTDNENVLAFARDRVNGRVQFYNSMTFPSVSLELTFMVLVLLL